MAIVGLGLIGGSIGLALKKYRPEIEVLGIARRQETVGQALEVGAADRASIDIGLVAEADMVVLACPLAATASMLERCAPLLAAGARVTDVGSVKREVAEHAERVLGVSGRRRAGNDFLGGHPMAGKEVSGIEHAEADLFRGRPWVFTPRSGWFAAVAQGLEAERAGSPGGYEPEGWQDLLQLVRDLGALPVLMPPDRHDACVALVSHVPFLLSAAFLKTVGEDAAWSEASRLASSGFRDFSRLGAGDPGMYAAIAAMNRDEVLRVFANLRLAIDEFEAAIARGQDADLRGMLERSKATRDDWTAAQPAPA